MYINKDWGEIRIPKGSRIRVRFEDIGVRADLALYRDGKRVYTPTGKEKKWEYEFTFSGKDTTLVWHLIPVEIVPYGYLVVIGWQNHEVRFSNEEIESVSSQRCTLVLDEKVGG